MSKEGSYLRIEIIFFQLKFYLLHVTEIVSKCVFLRLIESSKIEILPYSIIFFPSLCIVLISQ